MSINRVLFRGISYLCIVIFGLMLLTQVLGRVVPKAQLILISLQTPLPHFNQLYLLDPNRLIAGRILSKLRRFSEYSLSSDGQKIVVTFYSGKTEDNCTLLVYSWADGIKDYYPVPKTCVPLAPHWSPDNRYIIFNASTTTNLYVLSLENGAVQPVYHDLYSNRTAVWSPDGKLVAFLSSLDRTKPANSLNFIRLNCSTNCLAVNDKFATLHYPVLRESWSPDQSHMAFVSNDYGLGSKLMVWDAACLAQEAPFCRAKKEQLKEIKLEKPSLIDDREAVWSNDGQYLMFVAIIKRKAGFYRVLATCSNSPESCQPDLLFDFGEITLDRIQ